MSQILNNPFPYSNTNKRYYTLSYYFKQKYGRKVAKIPLDAGFTCPNRDGSKGVGGCLFCSSAGSGDTILVATQSLQEQYTAGLVRARKKWPEALGLPYFQSFTNTYAPLPVLKELYKPFLEDPDTLGIAIATRADCLDPAFIAFLAGYSNKKEIWIELGLQSIHESTMAALNRGHSTFVVENAVALLKAAGVKVCLHLINGLPGEDASMMMETARTVALWHPDAVKLHMLHVISTSSLGISYRLRPFPLLSQEEYVSMVCDQLEVLPADVIIERVTGDAVASDLIAPEWTLRKTAVANDIDKELFARNSWQGKYASPDAASDKNVKQ